MSTLSVVVAEIPLNIYTKNLPNAKSCIHYSHQLKGAGGKPPYTWKKGKNPNDIGNTSFVPSISEAGDVYGFPYEKAYEESHQIIAVLYDSTGKSVTKEFDIGITDVGIICDKQDPNVPIFSF
jgi:hypothetical protein